MKTKLSKLLAALLICAVALCSMPVRAFADQPAKKLVALTFDDGPCKDTERLLDGLKARGVKATFFILGSNARKFPAIVKRIYEEGHEVASHTYDHKNLKSLGSDAIKNQVDNTRYAINDAIGAYNDLIVRPPYGSVDQRVLDALGTPAIYWSVDSNDWRWVNDSAKTVREIMNHAFDGSIILVHDIHSWSVTAALQAVDQLLAKGYEFVTVSELFRRRGETLEAGKLYRSKPYNGWDRPAVSAPKITISRSGEQFFLNIDSDPGTMVYYTTDGVSYPNSAAVRYTEPVPIGYSLNITAVAGYNMNGCRSPKSSLKFCFSDSGFVYTDVFPENWFYPYVEYAVAKGIIDDNDGVILPNKYMTREMVIDMLYRAAGKPAAEDEVPEAVTAEEKTDFTDVSSDSQYYGAISWAKCCGIATGYPDGSFKPGDFVTRQQLAAFLQRYSENWLGNSDEQEGSIEGFADAKDISAYAKEAMAWAIGKGLMNGVNGNRLAPGNVSTKAQLAAMIMRLQEP